MKKNGLRIKSSTPSLDDRILTKIDPNKDTVYWYIKFNIALDPNSITPKTMYVSDVGGYVMNTFIEFSPETNLISIMPIDSYAQNTYYLLRIGEDVRSAKGNRLKKNINILFKLYNDKISNYEVLKKEVEVPEPQKRPKNYNVKNVPCKVYGLDKELYKDLKKDDLPTVSVLVNPAIGIIGLLLTVIGLIVSAIELVFISLAVLLIGIIHIVMQLLNKQKRATLIYNRGVYAFRKENYEKASDLFKKALDLDEYNEKIEFALNRVSYYL